MEFSTLFETFGSSAIFIAACFYLLKRIETRDAIRDKEARDREQQLSTRLNEGEHFVRDILVAQIEKNTTALAASGASMKEVAMAVQQIPCAVMTYNGHTAQQETNQPTNPKK